MRSIRAKHNMIAVSAFQKETGINVFQDLDLSLLTSVSDLISLPPRRETNVDEATGKEEADVIYDLGKTSAMSLTFEKAQPQHFAFLYAYALGVAVSAAAGTGYKHTITPLDGDLDFARSNPSFTAAGRIGKTIVRQRLASMFVNSVTSTFAKDKFCSVSAEIIGTGKQESSITEETVSALENATTITLAANAVAGSTAQERLDAVHQVRCETAPGVWTEVTVSAVNSAAPAELTITAAGAGTGSKNFKILYAPAETAWMTFPARVTETPLRVSEMKFVLGGKYDGTTFSGGREMKAEINSIEHKLSNNGAVEFSPGADGSFASRYFREGRDQTLSVNREFRDFIIQNYMDNNEYFGARILAEGMEFDTGEKYSVELIFPKLGVLNAAVSVDGKRIAEQGDFTVLQDDTYGSVIVNVKNLQAAYAA